MATLSTQDVAKLRRIISIAEKLLDKAVPPKRGRPSSSEGLAKPVRRRKLLRRRGKELVAFRKMIKAERKKGVPATTLARKHGVSTAYIYMIR